MIVRELVTVLVVIWFLAMALIGVAYLDPTPVPRDPPTQEG